MIEIEYSDMLKKDFKCPLCDKEFTCTKCGPTNNKWLTRTISLLPSSRLFKFACRIHDILYNIVPLTGVKIKNTPMGFDIEIAKGSRVVCDTTFRQLMDVVVSGMKWYCRPLYRKVASIYHRSVIKGGRGSFCHDHK